MFIRQFEYLDALAREKHFRRAAEACHVSQPTLSSALAQLEDELGVLLIERDSRFQGLTPEGDIVLARARRVLVEIEMMRAEIAEARDGISGKLRLGVIPTALPLAVHVTAPFCAACPAVTLEILSLTSAEILARLHNFELDAGMTYLDNEPLSGVIAKPIYAETYCLLTRADGPLADRENIAWAEAAELNLCLLSGDMQNRRIIDGIFRAVGKAPKPTVETNSIFNLCTHATIPGVNSIASVQVLEFFGLPLGVKALPLVEPEARRIIGLVAADRDPAPPLARRLMQSAAAL
ncbi:LysR family transcriptional regulator [Rhodoblastus acidophilus]|uniref:LysR family transcriptional regulator n=1 Tax=Candidatus Rhodoblastus alkanivorans TaxID=2954117 RepID=A0ABS9ZA28_9HYPH|nr:LysR family transcriptional regulator [Candidatus Rhodoblastus alkanivorans]MCI4679829.1 LysR family transcriptional regulator [Candidatus Rhodoblastus alkanivorans]MCI4684335.1 LysR family transcriptional regulator [Candidatus Rhodoblastus alkanivorans]MDI4641656.1 LysR family transcriptional regulator [Rhodoblastus acidophilus]